jgi:hypothetical protein
MPFSARPGRVRKYIDSLSSPGMTTCDREFADVFGEATGPHSDFQNLMLRLFHVRRLFFSCCGYPGAAIRCARGLSLHGTPAKARGGPTAPEAEREPSAWPTGRPAAAWRVGRAWLVRVRWRRLRRRSRSWPRSGRACREGGRPRPGRPGWSARCRPRRPTGRGPWRSRRPCAGQGGQPASHSATWRRSWPLPSRPFEAGAEIAGAVIGNASGTNEGGKVRAGARFAMTQVIN